MKRMLGWVIGLPVAIVLVAFAIANRQFVTISLDPFSSEDPWLGIELPLWSLLFIGIFLGLVSGWIGAWYKQRHWRREARYLRQDLERVRARADELERSERHGELQPLDE